VLSTLRFPNATRALALRPSMIGQDRYSAIQFANPLAALSACGELLGTRASACMSSYVVSEYPPVSSCLQRIVTVEGTNTTRSALSVPQWGSSSLQFLRMSSTFLTSVRSPFDARTASARSLTHVPFSLATTRFARSGRSGAWAATSPSKAQNRTFSEGSSAGSR
jgi:hypothetical protein